VDEPVRGQALQCIERMLDFVAQNPAAVTQPSRGFVANIGAA
jgi:quinolinate synthase